MGFLPLVSKKLLLTVFLLRWFTTMFTLVPGLTGTERSKFTLMGRTMGTICVLVTGITAVLGAKHSLTNATATTPLNMSGRKTWVASPTKLLCQSLVFITDS